MKIIVSVIYIFCGIIFLGLPFAFTLRMLIENILIIHKGEKFTAVCSRYKIEGHNSGHDVQWTDNSGRNCCRRFHILIIKFRYPFALKVYNLNNRINIGVFTIVQNVLWLGVCLFVWLVGIFGTVDFIIDLYKL